MIVFLVTLSAPLFSRHFGTNSDEGLVSARLTLDGAAIISGGGFNQGAGSYEAIAAKISPDGQIVWAKSFGRAPFLYDYFWDAIPVSDGTYLLVGESGSNAWCLRLSSSGDYIGFANVFGLSGTDIATSGVELIEGSDTSFVISGFCQDVGNPDALLVKINKLGDQMLWAKRFGGSGEDELFSACKSADGNYVLAGYTTSAGSGSADLLVVKCDGSGNIIWARAYGGGGYDEAEAIVQAQGGFFVAGFTWSYGANGDILLLKIDESGNLVWARNYGGNSLEIAWEVSGTPDGGCVLFGRTASAGAGGDDAFAMKVDNNGNPEWAICFGGAGFENAIGGFRFPEGGYFVGGTTDSYGFLGSDDIFYMRVAENGSYPSCVQSWSPIYGNPSPVQTNLSWTPTSISPSLPMGSMSILPQGYLPYDICAPVYENVEESDQYPGSTPFGSSVLGGLVFSVSGELDLRIYCSDGRLVLSRTLMPGQNKIQLEPGVYFWQAGQFKGKAVVR
ncbi:MAG: hypothetical protein ABIM88_02630 [candidate division WOR-3 bacterium]